jgi:hypothetical protein
MFDRTRNKVQEKVVVPVRNAMMTALMALAFSLVAVFIAVSKAF